MGTTDGSVNLQLTGDNEVRAALQRLGEVGRKHAEKAVHTTALALQNDAKKAAPVDTGALRASISWRKLGGYSAEVYTDKLYAAAVEYGRSAGRAMPPTGALDGWMRRHGVDPSMSFAIRRAIGENGIAARPFLMPAFEAQKGPFEQRMRKALKDATKEVGG